jgi:hypothetical protein
MIRVRQADRQITASPVLVIATEADPATPCYGGVAC